MKTSGHLNLIPISLLSDFYFYDFTQLVFYFSIITFCFFLSFTFSRISLIPVLSFVFYVIKFGHVSNFQYSATNTCLVSERLTPFNDEVLEYVDIYRSNFNICNIFSRKIFLVNAGGFSLVPDILSAFNSLIR